MAPTVTLYMFTGSGPSMAAALMLEHKAMDFERVHLAVGAHAIGLPARGFAGMTVPAMMVDGRRVQGSRRISRRAALAVDDGRLSIDARDRLESTPPQDLLQAGPLLVREGRSELAGTRDPEGFSATCEEFDEDITASREPRVAVALTGEELLAVAADGRSPADAGLTLWELADLLADLGANAALNLDGGSAGVVVAGGRRVNTPRDDEGNDMDVASPATTAIVISAR
jgi:exopolysaccharide biosynthesis protein